MEFFYHTVIWFFWQLYRLFILLHPFSSSLLLISGAQNASGWIRLASCYRFAVQAIFVNLGFLWLGFLLTWVFSLFQGLSSGRHGTATSGAKWVTVAILVYVNLINYMDRLTIAGRSQAVSNLLLPQSLTAVISSSLQSLLSSISFLNIFCYNIFLPPFSISSISSCHDLFLHDVFLPPISSCLRSLPASDIFLLPMRW